MNKVILIGRLTRDPELRTTTGGLVNSSFSLAVDRGFTNQQGERETDFISCVVWRKQAENLVKYCKKGSQIAVDGRIQTRTYDAPDGNRRYITEVIADNITFLGSKSSGQTSNYNSSNYNTQATGTFSQPNYGGENNLNNVGNNDISVTDLDSDPYAAMGAEVSLTDDDLPF